MVPDIDPGVRLVAEVSGDFIGRLPADANALAKNDEVVYGPLGGVSVTYKVKTVRYVAEYAVVPLSEGQESYSVYGRTDLIVSVIP